MHTFYHDLRIVESPLFGVWAICDGSQGQTEEIATRDTPALAMTQGRHPYVPLAMMQVGAHYSAGNNVEAAFHSSPLPATIRLIAP